MSKKLETLPDLRFPDFTNEDQWKVDAVQNLVTTKSPPKKLQSSEYLKEGAYPVIDQSQSFYCGYTNDQKSIIKEDLPLVIFGDHTCALKMAREPFAQGADGIKILKAKSILDPEYLYQYLFYNGVKQENYKRHYSKLKEKLIPYPEIETGEQQKIASCLSSLDELIAAHNDKLQVLKDHKKGLLQNLFPQEGEKVPKIRFSGFEKDGEWMEKQLGDEEVSRFVNAKISSKKIRLDNYISTANMLPEYSGISMATTLPSTGRVTKFVEGDILVSNIRPYLKKVWKSDKQGGASNDVLVFRSGSKVINEFLELILKNDAFINYVMRSAKGVKMPRGDKDSMQQYSVRLPSKQEQQKIASCLSAVDELITAQEDNIEQLQQHKKGLMQGFFPKVNELVV